MHGPFAGSISVDHERNLIYANGTTIQVIYARNPEDIDDTQYGIEDAILVDNTGVRRDTDGLGRYLQAKGIKKVLLTAPGKGDIPNIVYGINHDAIPDGQNILSAASCTTNAIVPVLKLVNDRFGIEHGHIETCHSYTNDQNLIDNYRGLLAEVELDHRQGHVRGSRARMTPTPSSPESTSSSTSTASSSAARTPAATRSGRTRAHWSSGAVSCSAGTSSARWTRFPTTPGGWPATRSWRSTGPATPARPSPARHTAT